MYYLRKFIHLLEYYYPLSFFGTLLIAIAIYLAGHAIGNSNVYALLIAVPLLFFILTEIIFIRLWSFRQNESELVWESTQMLTSRISNSELRLQLNATNPPYFFRYHLALHGKLNSGRNAQFYYHQEAASSSNGALYLPLYFPLSGILHLKSKLIIRDILGLSRTRVGTHQERILKIRPHLLEGKILWPNYSNKRLETHQSRLQSEDEKYYMREYIPGDRIKDINWKTSLRIGEVVTRYSPQSPKEQQLLHIELHNINIHKHDSPLALMQLEAVKSWLLSFITQIKRNNSNYQFLIESAHTSDLLTELQEIINFSEVLAGIKYVSPQQWHPPQNPQMPNNKSSDKVIFTTAFNSNQKNIANNEIVKTHVFQVTSAQRNDKKALQFNLLPLDYPLPWVGIKMLLGLLYSKSTFTPNVTNNLRHPLAIRFHLF